MLQSDGTHISEFASAIQTSLTSSLLALTAHLDNMSNVINPQGDMTFANDYLDEINQSSLADVDVVCTGLMSAILHCLTFYRWITQNTTNNLGKCEDHKILADSIAGNVPIFCSHCETLLTAQIIPVNLLVDFLRKATIIFDELGTIDWKSVTVCNFKKFSTDFEANFVQNLRAELFSESCVKSLSLVSDHTDTFQIYWELVPEECVAHLKELTDVYMLTILRFCASNIENEDVLVGITDPTTDKNKERHEMKNIPRSRKSKQQFHDIYLCDAKNITSICASNASDQKVIECIENARRSRALIDLTLNYEKLTTEEIFHARWNASQSLQIFGGILAEIYLGLDDEKYVSSGTIQIIRDRVHALTTMSTLCTRISCLRSIGPMSVLSSIATTDWCTDIIHTRANSFIDDLARRIIDLSSSLGNKVANDDMIDSLVTVSYLSILEGYTFVSRCSVQGRALMSLDLMHFRGCLLSAHLSPPEAIHNQIDHYIKAYYYPLHDRLNFISSHINGNFSYKLKHAVSLMKVRTEDDDGAEVEVWAEKVRDLYPRHE
mmetsp:Transcript_34416/g.49977  ORF Transcript_34416/g.49977 Transcript_34416/m.49977 type:complete len:549 (-) Transcript_34416:583-2229(-)